jgi:hypothetical protein
VKGPRSGARDMEGEIEQSSRGSRIRSLKLTYALRRNAEMGEYTVLVDKCAMKANC